MQVKAKLREEVNIVSLKTVYQLELMCLGLTEAISFLFATVQCVFLCMNGQIYLDPYFCNIKGARVGTSLSYGSFSVNKRMNV